MLSDRSISQVKMSKSDVHGKCLTSFQRKLLEKNLPVGGNGHLPLLWSTFSN
ncbi:hypothetical protein [Okeania sp. SIO2F5]|uniref:hypothetical protein n=1 Tax=Okeania sp. SIO2F5 TaxID=2607794 RepID=UPI0013B94B45|nr:hypothetical protein [Okeania sp. SIO2F5]NEP92246.1 hypothetical protein [Okeania sp. SIO2F5]